MIEPMPDDDMWRKLINSYTTDLPEDGTGPSTLETITPFAVDSDDDEDMGDDLFVQKVVTEMYIYTDSQNHVFGEHTFQDMVILGNMSKDKLTRLLNRQKRKREKGS